jgi:two-component system, NtrC family, sensor kinase
LRPVRCDCIVSKARCMMALQDGTFDFGMEMVDRDRQKPAGFPEDADPTKLVNRFKKIVEYSNEGILVFGADSRILYANNMAHLLLQAREEDMAGKAMDELVDSESLQQINDLRESCQGAETKICSTVSLMKIGGKPRHLEICIFCDETEGLTHLYMRDRTALTEALDELRRRNAFFNKLIESSVDGIIAADVFGKMLLFNKGAQYMLGYTEEEAMTQLHVSKLYPSGVAQEIMQKLRSSDFGGPGRCYKHRIYGITKTGDKFPISLSGAIIYDEDGREIATVGIFTDLRQIEKMERDLRSKQMELVQTERLASLGKLAAGVAHEINNPLTGILTFIEDLIDESVEDDERMEDYTVIRRETLRCREIVRNLLDFAKQDRPQMRPTDVNAMILQTFTMVRRLASFHNIEITHRLEDVLPSVVADPRQLQQVFLNMMVNASEAMTTGGELYIVSRLRKNGRELAVSFSDTGDGVPPEVLPKIFEPFFSTKGGRTNGLGLAVSYGIVHQHGGRIEVETAMGQGTSFHIFLPIASEGREPYFV